MTNLEKALLKAEEAFDKALFETAVGEIEIVVENNKKETNKVSRLEELETKLNDIDEVSLFEEILFGEWDDQLEAHDLMTLFEEEDNLLDDKLFVNPNKEARRKTYKSNISHKSRNIRGKDYLNYGKSKKTGRDIRWERLYNSNNKIRSKKRIDDKEMDMMKDIYSPDPFEWKLTADGRWYQESPMFIDGYKGEYRVINGFCYPSDYITTEETELTVQAVRMSESGYTNTGESCHLTYIVHPTSDGNGYLSATVSINKIRIYDSFNGCFNRYRGIEKAVEIFNVLTARKEIK